MSNQNHVATAIAISLLLMFISLHSTAQNKPVLPPLNQEVSPVFVNSLNVKSTDIYEKALIKTGINKFRLDDQDHVLIFESGLQVTIPSLYSSSNPPKIDSNIKYKISDDGYVLGMYLENTVKNFNAK